MRLISAKRLAYFIVQLVTAGDAHEDNTYAHTHTHTHITDRRSKYKVISARDQREHPQGSKYRRARRGGHYF